MLKEIQKLDLQFPRGWNQCTTRQLEQIAAVIAEEQKRVTRFRPFDEQSVKVALFFLFSGIKIIVPINPRVPVEDQYYVCRHKSLKEPFNLYLWQINYWLNGSEQDKSHPLPNNGRGQGGGSLFSWLFNPKSTGLQIMPYEHSHRSRFRIVNAIKDSLSFGEGWGGALFGKSFSGEGCTLLQGIKWRQYRFAQEYMSYYLQQNNTLLQMQKRSNAIPPKELRKQQKIVDQARASFLATIFNARTWTIDTDSHIPRRAYVYTSNQHTDNVEYFRNFPEDKWQVILFWWSGQMRYLHTKYKHCFKEDKVARPTNPLELYTRTVATMEKYLSLDEEKVNRETVHNVLQHLEDMAAQNEELDRMRHRHK